jgi:hypothetical protein
MATRTAFDLKTVQAVAERPFYATVGVTDLAVEAVREYVTDVQSRVLGFGKDVQKNVASVDLQPKVLRDTAVTVVSERVEALQKDAQARRTAFERRVAELQGEAKAVPSRVQSLVDENVTALEGAYGDLIKRGESLVGRIRRQQSTQDTVKAAETTVAKAKTTRTQATKATRTTAKKATGTAKRQSATSRGSAKATVTAAKKTASSAARAAAEAAEKVGD